MKVKWIKKHKKNCTALATAKRGDWPTPWAYTTDEYITSNVRSPNGRNGYTRWRTVICNSTSCQAKIAYREKDFLAKLPKE